LIDVLSDLLGNMLASYIREPPFKIGVVDCIGPRGASVHDSLMNKHVKRASRMV
jgi:hypothetical protein